MSKLRYNTHLERDIFNTVAPFFEGEMHQAYNLTARLHKLVTAAPSVTNQKENENV